MNLRSARILTLAVCAWSAGARAQPNDAARALKVRGDELMQELHFREALGQYDAALALGGGAAIHYNRARALQALGEYPRALDALEEFVRTATPELRARVPELDELIADLHAHIATITIACDVPNATVRIRHELVGTTPIAVPIRVSVGPALVEVEAVGYRAFSREQTLSRGDTTVEVKLEKIAKIETGPAFVVAPQHAEVGRIGPTPLRIGAFVTGGVGLASLATGAIFGGLAVAKRGQLDALCPDRACGADGAQARSDAWTFATLSTVGLVAGGALVTGAVVLYLLEPKHGAPRTGVVVVPFFGPAAAGLSGAF